jgi:hypothetical protein
MGKEHTIKAYTNITSGCDRFVFFCCSGCDFQTTFEKQACEHIKAIYCKKLKEAIEVR